VSIFDSFRVGHRVLLARTGPAFGSEEAAKAVEQFSGLDGVRAHQAGFEGTLKDRNLEIGSQGIVRKVYTSGYAEVEFENGTSLDVPMGLLDLVQQ